MCDRDGGEINPLEFPGRKASCGLVNIEGVKNGVGAIDLSQRSLNERCSEASSCLINEPQPNVLHLGHIWLRFRILVLDQWCRGNDESA